jgi:type IV secretory pathway VirB3-like protein
MAIRNYLRDKLGVTDSQGVFGITTMFVVFFGLLTFIAMIEIELIAFFLIFGSLFYGTYRFFKYLEGVE